LSFARVGPFLVSCRLVMQRFEAAFYVVVALASGVVLAFALIR
jgi:hypothetical protein